MGFFSVLKGLLYFRFPFDWARSEVQ